MNLSTKQILLIFFPVVITLGVIFALEFYQYEPLYPNKSQIKQQKPEVNQLPVFQNDFILGNKSAPKTIITFEDLGCSACKNQYEIFQKLIKKYPNKIKVVWKPLTVKKIPVSSKDAHHYAFCLSKQEKFSKFAELAFANSNNLTQSVLESISKKINSNQSQLDSCLKSKQPETYLEKNKQLAKLMNVQSVPAIFINGKEEQEPKTLNGWESLLNLK
jgi:protein-disulfide isomerase